jgi:hypothetical protein
MDIVQRRPTPVKSGKVEGTRPARLTGEARREFERTLTSRPGLRGSRLAVLRVLLDQWGWGKPSCRPCNATIAAAAGVSVSTVQRCLHDLEQLGVLDIEMGVHGENRVIRFVGHPLATGRKLTCPPAKSIGPPFQPATQSVTSFSEPQNETVGKSSLEQERATKVQPGFDWRSLVDDPIVAAALKPPPVPQVAPAEIADAPDDGLHLEAEQCNSEPVRGLQVADEAEVIQCLAALKPGATKQEIAVATLKLTRLFKDPGSRRFYSGVVLSVGRGELPARVVVAAVQNSSRPGVIKPAAVFTAHIRRCERAAHERPGSP